MKRFGLLGEKLSHSFSPQIHGLLADYEYKLYEKSPSEIESFLTNSSLDGMNVTIPYKTTVIPYCSYLSDTAKKVGSVNTLIFKDGGWHGYNTDYFGFVYMLKSAGICPKGKKVLVLGSGGASLTVREVLSDLGAKSVVIISRSGENNYDNIEKHFDADIIVNTTPVGMYPNNLVSPLSLNGFKNLCGVADLIYNPAKTKLLLVAESRSIPCTNGLSMPVAQAKLSAEIFLQTKIPDSKIDDIAKKISGECKNIALIGMPGCGKSHIAALLSQSLGRPYVDIDSLIVSLEGNIEDIFKLKGEKYFRNIETTTLAEVSKRSGQIISTGGGCVTTEENYNLLRQNSTVFWLKRDIDSLPKDGRPLSKSVNLEDMYNLRKPLYERFCDYIIDNNDSPEKTVQKIKECLE